MLVTVEPMLYLIQFHGLKVVHGMEDLQLQFVLILLFMIREMLDLQEELEQLHFLLDLMPLLYLILLEALILTILMIFISLTQTQNIQQWTEKFQSTLI